MNSTGFKFYIGSCLDRLCICIVQLDMLKTFLSDLGESICRAAVPVWASHYEKWVGQDHGEHSKVSSFEHLIPQFFALLRYQGVIVHSMADLPIGFGVAAKATSECRHADPMNIVAFHQV